MLTANENYIKYVENDLKNHKGLLHPIDANILFRIKTLEISPKKLHPNPEDEFSMDKFGPNWEIVSNYENDIRLREPHGLTLFDEPIIVVKLDKGGYMLLNGHHRWMAALNVGVKKVPVKVVNCIHEDDISKRIQSSDRDKCVTIDFDEVLFSDTFQAANNKVKFPFNHIYKKNIRENTSYIVRELQRIGYDVWIYTGSYLSEKYLTGLFAINNCKVDGIVNGLNGKRNSKKMKEEFRSKYKQIIHVSNEMITCVDTATRDYQSIDINVPDGQWAAAVVENVNKL